jgi:hypothetical protein
VLPQRFMLTKPCPFSVGLFHRGIAQSPVVAITFPTKAEVKLKHSLFFSPLICVMHLVFLKARAVRGEHISRVVGCDFGSGFVCLLRCIFLTCSGCSVQDEKTRSAHLSVFEANLQVIW